MKRGTWHVAILRVALLVGLVLAAGLAGCTGAQIEAGAPNITVPPAVVHQAPFPTMTGDQVEAQIKANAEYPVLREWWRRYVTAWAASRN